MSLRKLINLSITSALSALLVSPGLLLAEQEERWYQVEIILFSQNNPDYRESELWPVDFALPDLEKSRELVKAEKHNASQPASLLPEPFSLVSNDALQLADTAQRIKHASDVELVLHLGWLQPGLAEDQAVAVHLYDGMLEQAGQASGEKSEALSTRTPETASLASNEMTPLPKLDGTLRLVLSRYLHLETDLVWREPLPAALPGFAADMPLLNDSLETPATAALTEVPVPAGNSDIDSALQSEQEIAETTPQMAALNYQVFRLQQSRRMRSSEIHYLDHPLFGIVALVTPYEIAQPDDAGEPVTAPQP